MPTPTVPESLPGPRPRASSDLLFRWIQEYVRRRNASAESRGRASGDIPLPQLRERIAQAHAPLVESVARKYVGTGEPLEDLVQEGYVGLLSALENYQPEKGVRFSTYATHFITGSIRHFLRDRSRIIREPAWIQEIASRMERAQETLALQFNRRPELAEIAQYLAVPLETVEEIAANRSLFQVVTLEGPEENEGADLERFDTEETSLQALVENKVLLEQLLRHLKPLEQQTLYEFYYRGLNQTEIAAKFGISCNYVSVTLRNATKKLGRMVQEAEVRDRTRRSESTILDLSTGLYTQAHLYSRLDESLSRAARAGEALSLIYFALYGLPTGGRARDDALSHCGQRLRSSIRRRDLAGRWEGDSLLTILAGTGPQVDLAAPRLVGVLEDASRAVGVSIRVHAGTAWYPEQGRTADELLKVARGAVWREPILRAA